MKMKSFKLSFLYCIYLLFVLSSAKAQWVQVSNGIGNQTVYALATSGNTMFAGTYLNGVYISADEGATWVQSSLNNYTILAFTVSGTNIFAGSDGAGVFLSSDNGVSWSQTSLNNVVVRTLTVNGSVIFAGGAGGVRVSTDNGMSWSRTSLKKNTYSLTQVGYTTFAGTSIDGLRGGILYLSNDNGSSWIQTSLNWSVYAIAVHGSQLFAACEPGGVFESADNGFNWISTALDTNSYVHSLAVNGNNLIAGTAFGPDFSSDNGLSWILHIEGLTTETFYDIVSINNNIYAATGNGVWLYDTSLVTIFEDNAENGFGNWETNWGWDLTTDISHSPEHSFTDSPKGKYRNNEDNSMTLISSLNLLNYDNLVLSFWHKVDTEQGSDVCYVEISGDNGNSWQEVQNYSGSLYMRRAGIDITNYVNHSENVKIRFRLTSDNRHNADGWYVDDIKITGKTTGDRITRNQSNFISPKNYFLSQNYPNPFNPTTTIKFSLQKSSYVKLTVYDITGRTVQTLVNEKLEAGTHSVNFYGGMVSSGVYFYKLKAENFSDVKKMVLIK
jgi:hypothetical protein